MNKNIKLKKIYNKAFLKGEEKHFTGKDDLEEDPEFVEVLKGEKWKNKKVLDVGCGTGKLDFLIVKRDAEFCKGVDYSSEAIKIAKNKYKHKNLSFENVDITKKFSGKYDVIISVGTLEHQDNPFDTLKLFKKHLTDKGKIIITCPNWTNPRGYILMTLFHLFNLPITLADLHFFTPKNFEEWSKNLKMELKWKTFDKSWGHGEKMIKDLKKRLPKVLEDGNMKNNSNNIQNLISWLNDKVLPLENESKISGASAIYIFSKK
tara:strand:+ start:690 stop:1475 length:786 start_codon:yes stop_codon:yes gene_type:complete